MFRLWWLLPCLAPSLAAWGLKAHEMQLRAAVRALPPEVPAFFRSAREELVFVGSEPDRWRRPEFPAVTEATGPDHVFAVELAPPQLPPTRHAHIAWLHRQGLLDEANPSLRRIGLGPWAIAEWSEMLTGAFRRWRAMPARTRSDRRRKHQHERDILFMAGVLAHWAGDLSMPLHCSVHVLGWSPKVPNPQGYTTDPGIHQRYEAAYVESAIDDDAVWAALPAPRELGPSWLDEAFRHARQCQAGVESIYRWDLVAPFGSGKEDPAARAFTAQRLAAGAAMIRDLWIACWRRSAPA